MLRSAWRLIDRTRACGTATAVFLLGCSPAVPKEARTTAPVASSPHVDEQPTNKARSSLLAVQKTKGCGVAPTQELGTFVKHSLDTSGTKAADCAAKDADSKPVCGPWSVKREYYVWLPANYDKNRAYSLVFQGPGCHGS